MNWKTVSTILRWRLCSLAFWRKRRVTTPSYSWLSTAWSAFGRYCPLSRRLLPTSNFLEREGGNRVTAKCCSCLVIDWRPRSRKALRFGRSGPQAFAPFSFALPFYIVCEGEGDAAFIDELLKS